MQREDEKHDRTEHGDPKCAANLVMHRNTKCCSNGKYRYRDENPEDCRQATSQLFGYTSHPPW